MAEYWAEVFIELLPTASGGRQTPVDLNNDHPGSYRPHLRVVGGSGEMLGVAFMDGPDEPVSPGESAHATIQGLYSGVSYQELVEGAQFEILEGARVVGSGRVVRV